MTPLPSGCVERCPGCRYRVLPPSESDARKQAWVASCLAPRPVAAIRSPARRLGYRRKALLHAGVGQSGWELGLLRRLGPQRREKELIPIPACPLHEPALNDRLTVLRSLVPDEAPLAFVQASGRVLTLVLKCAPSPRWLAWARAIEKPLRASGVESLFLNWNPSAGRRALSSRHQELVFGTALVEEAGLKHGALSFRQQIPEVENAALGLAEAFLGGSEVVVDLYSGAGTSLARWRARGARVAGVELVAEACRAAELNAPGTLVLKGRAEHRLPQLDEFLRGAPFAVYTNPPRDGHAGEILAWLALRAPERIAYLSCNARSLARDLETLQEHYELAAPVQPFDFFPLTDHVECLALLARKR